MRRHARWIVLVLGAAALPAAAAEMPPPLPDLRAQDTILQEWLELRLERVLPPLMRRHGVAMWIVVCREYNEDPVFFSLVSPSVMAARRRTILVFHDRGPEQGVERLALGGGGSRGLYEAFRDPDGEDRELWGQGQWRLLRKLVDDRQPATIGINVSHVSAFSDGLSASERESLEAALGPWRSRIVRAEGLPLEYISIRLPEMLPTYRLMMRNAHAIIATAFSNEVITPGKTTTRDVVWWMREKVRALGHDEWFPPSVSVQRAGTTRESLEESGSEIVIQRGDHLHTDFGISAMGLNTDTQHVGYVLKEGETEAPEGLRQALAVSNRLQDLLVERLRPGHTGNEILADTLAAMKAEGIDGTVYSHPVGDHGHGAGPLIGLWDRQEGVPGKGDLLVLPSTWYSIELQATIPVPEWDGQELRSAQEEDVTIDASGRVAWVLERQTRYHLVR
jgi:hypothetical protein